MSKAISLLLLSALPAFSEPRADLLVSPKRVLHPLDRRIFGHHLEHFGRIIQGGLLAELLQNRKFYPIDPDRTNVADPWWPETDRSNVSYAIDRSETLDGISSQRISPFGSVTTWRGISQRGFDVLGGRDYIAYAWIRCMPASRSVSFRLESADGHVAAHAEAALTEGGFTKYRVSLKPDRDLRPAVLRIAFDTPGVNWIGAASLMPADNVDGLRAEVLTLIATLRPTIFRWPGGGYPDVYDWRKAIGPRDLRPPQDILPFGQPGGYDHGVDPNDFGTDEFLRLCERVHAEPYITANFGSGTPQMAASWVEYCNGPASSAWGARRRAHGREPPYRVRLWSIGNENWGPFETGYTNGLGYAALMLPIARAMRSVDPSISITGVGRFDIADRRQWNMPVITQGWQDLDMLSLHHYYPGGFIPAVLRNDAVGFYRAVVAEPSLAEIGLREMIAAADSVIGDRKKLFLPLDEWGEWDWAFEPPSDRPERSAMNQFIDLVDKTGLEFNQTARDGLFGARMLHVMMRLCDRVPIGIRTHLVNSLGAIRTDSTRSFITASGKTMELYSGHAGDVVLQTDQESPTFDVTQMGWKGIPYLDAVATYTPARSRLYLHLVNLHPFEGLVVHVRLNGRPFGPATQFQIAAADFLSRNDFGVTNVSIQSSDLGQIRPEFECHLPKHSITIIECNLQP
jgi:alpha-N-arabinofuranosidase